MFLRIITLSRSISFKIVAGAAPTHWGKWHTQCGQRVQRLSSCQGGAGKVNLQEGGHVHTYLDNCSAFAGPMTATGVVAWCSDCCGKRGWVWCQ
jgi:hypothetical protein